MTTDRTSVAEGIGEYAAVNGINRITRLMGPGDP